MNKRKVNLEAIAKGTPGMVGADLENIVNEAALLAALPKAPSKYNPYKNIKLAKFRRDLVLKNLFDNNYINKTQYNQLIQKEIILKKRKKIYYKLYC